MNTAGTPIPFQRRFVWLLRREFWEHKGGFFWAPIWAAGISLLLTLMAFVFAEVVGRKTMSAKGVLGDGAFMVNGIDLNSITVQMSPDDLRNLAEGLTMSMASAMMWPMLVLGFVVFFYCLGSLYEDRRDRSILFWKSLPLSDRDTVVSKVVSALLVAPVIATLVGVVSMLAFLLVLSAFVLLHNGNPFVLLWHPGSILGNIGVALAALPIYALWALPSVGWLMLCSAWARSKPFLWALMLPIFAGIFLTWFDWMSSIDLHSTWFWKKVVGHLLLGVFPGTWASTMRMETLLSSMWLDHMQVIKAMYGVLAEPQLWAGAIAGVAMIYAAIRLRRSRDDT